MDLFKLILQCDLLVTLLLRIEVFDKDSLFRFFFIKLKCNHVDCTCFACKLAHFDGRNVFFGKKV